MGNVMEALEEKFNGVIEYRIAATSPSAMLPNLFASTFIFLPSLRTMVQERCKSPVFISNTRLKSSAFLLAMSMGTPSNEILMFTQQGAFNTLAKYSG